MKISDAIKKLLDTLVREGDRQISSLQIFCGNKNMCIGCEHWLTPSGQSHTHPVCLFCKYKDGVPYEDFDLFYGDN